MDEVSVIVLSHNCKDNLEKCLNSLLNMDYASKFEIIVVDSLSTDGTAELAKSLGARVIQEQWRGFGYMRNLGVANARYPIIAFTDSDCMVTKNWLTNIVADLKLPEVLVAGGVALASETNTLGYCVSALGYPAGGDARRFEPKGYTYRLATCNLATTKSLMKQLNYFDESMVYGAEENDFMRRVLKIGKAYFNPETIIFHRPRENFRHFIKWWFLRGKSNYFIDKKYTAKQSFATLISTTVIGVLIIVLLLCNLPLGLASIFLLLGYMCFWIFNLQKNYVNIKPVLPIPIIHYYTTIPFLEFLKNFFNDVGRLWAALVLKPLSSCKGVNSH